MHWLDCVQVPARERVVRSKISIALLVPVMVALAVAVRTARSPGCRKVLPASSSTRWVGRDGRSVETGTLGLTWGAESPFVAASTPASAGSRTSAHAARLPGAGWLPAGGQGVKPSGVEATPGAIPAGSSVVHAAPGP